MTFVDIVDRVNDEFEPGSQTRMGIKTVFISRLPGRAAPPGEQCFEPLELHGTYDMADKVRPELELTLEVSAPGQAPRLVKLLVPYWEGVKGGGSELLEHFHPEVAARLLREAGSDPRTSVGPVVRLRLQQLAALDLMAELGEAEALDRAELEELHAKLAQDLKRLETHLRSLTERFDPTLPNG